MSHSPRRSAAVALAAALTALATVGASIHAQTPAAARADASWIVTSDEFVDLWFHCLAVVGDDGFGPLPLYDAGYATKARAERRRRGQSTKLDENASELRAGFGRDSAFEVLHFLPLYLSGREPQRALADLRAALGPIDVRSGGAARLVAAALPLRMERDLLRTFVDAVSDEWTWYAREDGGRQRDVAAVTRRLQSVWTARFLPPLAPYLSAMGIERGTILVTPAVGGEGRIVRAADGAALVVVSSDQSGGADAPLLEAVHELAFPLLDRLRAPLARSTERVAAARARDAAAVRAAALLLDAADPTLASAYRRRFVELSHGRSFDAGYPMDARAETELRALIAATVRSR